MTVIQASNESLLESILGLAAVVVFLVVGKWYKMRRQKQLREPSLKFFDDGKLWGQWNQYETKLAAQFKVPDHPDSKAPKEENLTATFMED